MAVSKHVSFHILSFSYCQCSQTFISRNTAFLKWPLETSQHVIAWLLLWEAWVFAIVPWPTADPLDPDLLPLRRSKVTAASIAKAPSLPPSNACNAAGSMKYFYVANKNISMMAWHAVKNVGVQTSVKHYWLREISVSFFCFFSSNTE